MKIKRVRPFTEEQERRLKEQPIKDIRKHLDALALWRKKFLNSDMVLIERW